MGQQTNQNMGDSRKVRTDKSTRNGRKRKSSKAPKNKPKQEKSDQKKQLSKPPPTDLSNHRWAETLEDPVAEELRIEEYKVKRRERYATHWDDLLEAQ
eukprot:m.261266 g.261266  ORF g.261266 m.261266 type:complete len:98 (-) comp41769_c0_seq1:170-463(-)